MASRSTDTLRIGRGSIFLKGDIWQARWREHGNRRSLSTKARTEAGAISFASKINEALERYGEYAQGDTSTTVDEAFSQFEARYKGWRPSTRRGAASFIHKRFLPALGTRRIGSIQTKDLKRVLSTMEDGRDPRRGPIAPSTYNRCISYMSCFFRESIEYGLCDENPAKGLRRRKEIPNVPEALSQEEIDSLLTYLQQDSLSPYAYYIACMAVDTGMRRGELYALQWDDIDFAANEIRVDDSVDIAVAVEFGKGTKTGLVRGVPMTPRVAALLKARAEEILKLPGEHPPIPLLDIRKALKNAAAAVGIRHVHFHMFRHTAATLMLESGMTIEDVQRMLGHRNILMTRRYAKTSQDRLHVSFKKFADART